MSEREKKIEKNVIGKKDLKAVTGGGADGEFSYTIGKIGGDAPSGSESSGTQNTIYEKP